MKDILPSSDRIANFNHNGGQSKYPWRTMDIGTSFNVSYSEAKGTSLRSYASLMGKRTGRKFRVIDHGEIIGHEVARIT